MTHYRQIGDVPRKRHVVHRDGAGARLLEELMGSEGFAGPSSLLYHRRSPSALLGVETVDDDAARTSLIPNHPVRPLHLRAAEVEPGGDAVTGRTILAGNDDVILAVAAPTEPSPLYRHAAADERVFVHDGRAVVETTFGALAVGPGDHVVLPAGTTHRWVPDEPLRLLVIESAGHVGPPARYLTAGGQFREGTPYCERDLRAPAEPLVVDGDGPVDVLVRTRAGLTRHTHRDHPFDVVGWDGALYPYAFSIRDFEPIVGSLHQPPPVHQTFAGRGFVLCAFVPRLFDTHPDAVKIPYFHSNVDSDEVLYYVDGDFMSRRGSGIGRGSISIHPAGFVHGPQPGSWEASVDATRTEETAVMLDTFAPLRLDPAALRALADETYLSSWTR